MFSRAQRETARDEGALLCRRKMLPASGPHTFMQHSDNDIDVEAGQTGWRILKVGTDVSSSFPTFQIRGRPAFIREEREERDGLI